MNKLIITIIILCLIYQSNCTIISSPNTSTIPLIVDACYDYLESHLCEGTKWGKKFHFYKPANQKYSADQWLWDSGSHMIVWSHKNVTNSILDLRTMLHFQDDNGFIPEEIFWSNRTVKENAEILLQYSNIKHTDTTQMPVLAHSLRAIANQVKLNNGILEEKLIIKEFLYPLINYFKWWRTTRDLGDGLVVAIHNWETGMDASPSYDPAFHVYITELNKTAFYSLYPKFLEVAESYKFIYHWNVSEILSRTVSPDKLTHIDKWFVVKDVGLNSVYSSGWNVLADLARKIGDDETAEYCDKEAKVTSVAIVSKMFITEQNRFQTLYIDSDGVEKVSIANTIQNLFPLLLKDLPNYHIDAIMLELEDSNKFGGDEYAIPTVAKDDPQFSATFDVDLMWRGPIWGFTNWYILEGLDIHNKKALQEKILIKWLNLVKKNGIWEHYNPIDGTPYGPEGLGMSTLICDWIYRYGWI